VIRDLRNDVHLLASSGRVGLVDEAGIGSLAAERPIARIPVGHVDHVVTEPATNHIGARVCLEPVGPGAAEQTVVPAPPS
jgi:hypothetical protein